MTRDPPLDGMSRRKALQGIASLAGASALSGCASVLGKSGVNTLRYAQVLPPVTLDPIVIDEPWSAQAASSVFQGLYTHDFDLNLRPVLATEKPSVSDDGRTYTVSINEKAKFQDGTSVTAEDVKYSFEPETYEAIDSPNRWQVKMIEEIRTPDQHTVEFRLKYPYPAFGTTLTRAVVPKSARAGSPEAFGTSDPVGSGPYKVDIFKPDKYVVLTGWKNYWGDVDLTIEKIKMIQNHAGLARSMSLKTGQNDIVERVQPNLWESTEKMAHARVSAAESYHSHFVAFNCSEGSYTSDPKVREAIDYLFTMDDFVEHIVEMGGRRQHSPLPRQVANAWNMPVEKWKGIPHRKNEEEAKLLLKEAGVKKWSPKIAVPEDPMREKLAETIVHGLRSIGYRKARVKKYKWSDFRKNVTTGDSDEYAMYIGSWPGYADPDTFLYPLFHRSMEGLTNGTYYRNEELMRKLERARRTTKRKERQKLYTEAVTTLLEDRVHLPAFTLKNSFGLKDRVRGFEPHPFSQLNPVFVGPDGHLVERGGGGLT